jgi:hypothetical protein
MSMMTELTDPKLHRDTAALARRLARNMTHEPDRERLFEIARELEDEAHETEAREDVSNPGA